MPTFPGSRPLAAVFCKVWSFLGIPNLHFYRVLLHLQAFPIFFTFAKALDEGQQKLRALIRFLQDTLLRGRCVDFVELPGPFFDCFCWSKNPKKKCDSHVFSGEYRKSSWWLFGHPFSKKKSSKIMGSHLPQVSLTRKT